MFLITLRGCFGNLINIWFFLQNFKFFPFRTTHEAPQKEGLNGGGGGGAGSLWRLTVKNKSFWRLNFRSFDGGRLIFRNDVYHTNLKHKFGCKV